MNVFVIISTKYDNMPKNEGTFVIFWSCLWMKKLNVY